MTSNFELRADGIYHCPELSRFEWLEHGFGSRLGNPQADVTLRQIHSGHIWTADGLADREQEGDALITDRIGFRIGVRTADCVPILLLDSETHAVAAVHAGWRGSAAEILSGTAARLCADYGGKPSQVYAAIGPCIRECCYQVGAEVARQFASFFPEWGSGEPRQRYLNLAEANTRQLKAMGVPADQIFDSGLCTACSSAPLFSYRREPENPGRMVAAIARLA